MESGMMKPRLRRDRLKEEMRLSGFDHQDDLADALGIRQSSVSKIVNGPTENSRHLPRIAELLGVNIGWLLGTSDDRHAQPKGFYEEVAQEMNAAFVAEVDLRYSMGGGAFIQETATNRVPLPKNWVRPFIKGTFEQVFIAYPVGDSMEPTINHGDPVLVDRSQTSITAQDQIWCITYGELGMIKRVRRMGDGGYEINSDNPSVTPITAYDDEMHVVGRVVWIGRRV
jgi:phage repressor protein C with HTH and peptisase S24 domain